MIQNFRFTLVYYSGYWNTDKCVNGHTYAQDYTEAMTNITKYYAEDDDIEIKWVEIGQGEPIEKVVIDDIS